MPAQQHSTKLKIEVEGTPLPDDVDHALISAVVDNCSSLPDMFQITFRDAHRKILEDTRIKVGTKVKIKAFSDAEPAGEVLTSGEVTALEAEYDPDGTSTVVRGYDHGHRLFRGRVTAAYTNVTYSDVATQVARRANLEIGEVEASTQVHDHVSQANVSDWQFLHGLADELGFEVSCVDGKFVFRSPPRPADAPSVGNLNSDQSLQLTLGQRLLSFRAIVSAAEQVSQVKVRGWDPMQKKAIVGVAPASSSGPSIGVRGGELASTFSSPDYVSVHTPHWTQAQADAHAKAISAQIGDAAAELEGVARGDPKLRAGVAVSLGLVGKPFDGKYTLTSTRHHYDPKDGYTTSFTVSGRQERSLFGLVSCGGSGSAMAAPVYGVVHAVVNDIKDPLDECRVKLQFPWLSDDYTTDWARTVQSGAGLNRGGVMLSQVGDEVLVAFEQGDIRRPYVIGGLFNHIDKPELDGGVVDGANGSVKRRMFVSKDRHILSFEDNDSKSGIWLKTGKGNLEISLDATGTKITISNGSGDIEIKGTNIKVNASGTLELKGSGGVKIDGSSSVEVTGASIKLN